MTYIHTPEGGPNTYPISSKKAKKMVSDKLQIFGTKGVDFLVQQYADADLHIVTVSPKPEISENEVAELSVSPTISEGAWSRGWTVRVATAQELLDRVPWQTLADAQFELATWINKLTYQVDGKYPQIVKEGWGEEEAMAVAFMTGTETPEQLAKLQGLAATKNRTVAQHVERVLFLAGSFYAIKDVVHELWLATDGALENANSPLEYLAIFETAKATAAPLAAAYGLVIDD